MVGSNTRESYISLQGADELQIRSVRFAYHTDIKALMLQRNDALQLHDISRQKAQEYWEKRSRCIVDNYGQIGRISPDAMSLEMAPHWQAEDAEYVPILMQSMGMQAISAQELELHPVTVSSGQRIVDLASRNELLALIITNDIDEHRLRLMHTGSRWQTECELPAQPISVYIDHAKQIWVLCVDQLVLCTGEPLPQHWQPDRTQFNACIDNPNALSVKQIMALPQEHQVRSISGDRDNLYILSWGESEQQYLLVVQPTRHELSIKVLELPNNISWGIDMSTVGLGRVALLIPHDQYASHRDCPVVQIDKSHDELQIRLLCERYPLHGLTHKQFVTAPDNKARYLSDRGVQPVLALPQARYLSFGLRALRPVDSYVEDNCWHRLCIDACIPQGSHISIEARVADSLKALKKARWHKQPSPVKQVLKSELAEHNLSKHKDGITWDSWDILLQRGANSGPVRELRGRYIQLKIGLKGNGYTTPLIHRLRLWKPRLSWQQNYLPEFFHQTESIKEVGAANGADVRERMFAAFEGIITPIARRIHQAEILLDPLATPRELLPGIAKVLGVKSRLHWPDQVYRNWLASAAELQQWQGTFTGICLALDIVTDGGVTRGDVIPFENYRLRRPLLTIIGQDHEDDDHPLTLGTAASGNSIVGDTLTLNQRDVKQLVLDLLLDEERKEVKDNSVDDLLVYFFNRYSHRVSVILHGNARNHADLVTDLLAEEIPAHLSWKTIKTEHPFVLGLSPLLGVNSFIEQTPGWKRIKLDQSRIGGEAVLQNTVALNAGFGMATTME